MLRESSAWYGLPDYINYMRVDMIRGCRQQGCISEPIGCKYITTGRIIDSSCVMVSRYISSLPGYEVLPFRVDFRYG